jgi:exosortase/archaeosortase
VEFSGQLGSFSASALWAAASTKMPSSAIPAKGFSMEIRDGCNGVNVVILLWAAILAYPSNWRWKVTGLAAGLAAIQFLNLFRLISLYFL